MLSKEELLELLKDLESDRVERTTSTTNTDKFAQAVCAFANDYPNHRKAGYLIIGANDDGGLAGMSVSDELLRNLAGIRADGNVLPPPAMSIEKMTLGDEAKISDVTLRLFDEYRSITVDPETIAANHRTTEEKLASLRCFDLLANAPTVAGILLFGTNPRYFLPGAYIQFLKFPGITMTEMPDDQLEISGDLRSVLDVIYMKVKAYNRVSMNQGSSFKDKIRPDYPEWALRELLHNAVMHRDYASTSPIRFYWFSDRIEIQSPGGLFGTVTRDTLMRRNSYRNPMLAEAMKAMSYVNRYGYGIQRAEALMQENGNPPLTFEIDDRVFGVILRGGQA